MPWHLHSVPFCVGGYKTNCLRGIHLHVCAWILTIPQAPSSLPPQPKCSPHSSPCFFIHPRLSWRQRLLLFCFSDFPCLKCKQTRNSKAGGYHLLKKFFHDNEIRKLECFIWIAYAFLKAEFKLWTAFLTWMRLYFGSLDLKFGLTEC